MKEPQVHPKDPLLRERSRSPPEETEFFTFQKPAENQNPPFLLPFGKVSSLEPPAFIIPVSYGRYNVTRLPHTTSCLIVP